MTSHEINSERLKLLISGLVDGEKFKMRIKEIRKKLGIPNKGLRTIEESQAWHKTVSIKQDEIMTNPEWIERVYALDKNDPEYDTKYRNLHKEAPVNFLTYSIDELMEEYQDLSENLSSSVHDFILFNSISSPYNSRVYSRHKGDRHVIGIEVFGYVTEEEMESAFNELRVLHDVSFRRVKPLSNLDQDIEILKLSQKKGTVLASNTPEIEEDGKYSDAAIVSAILPEKVDTKSKLKKNKAYVRKRRSRVSERIQKHFPKASKKRRDR